MKGKWLDHFLGSCAIALIVFAMVAAPAPWAGDGGNLALQSRG